MPIARDPEDVREFLSESLIALENAEPVLAQLQAESENEGLDISGQIAGIFRAFHSIKGVAGFLSFLQIQDVTHKAEETMDRVRTGKRKFTRELGTALLDTCDLLRKYFSSITATGEDSGSAEEKDALIARLKTFSEIARPGSTAMPASSVQTVTPGGWLFDWMLHPDLGSKFAADAEAEVTRIEQVLIGLLDAPTKLDLLQSAGSLAERLRHNAAALGYSAAAGLSAALADALCKPKPGITHFDPAELSIYFGACHSLKQVLMQASPSTANLEQAKLAEKELENIASLKLSAPNSGGPGQEAQNHPATEAAPAGRSNGSAAAGGKNEIRVSLERLDKMVDLIEELGVVSTGVVQAADLSEDGSGLRQSASKLRKLTEELQEITVSIRMVPLSSLFRKMIRLVGDVSAKLGKKARLEIVGEQTELDKDAVESLQDPLVHILRNCLDHGLEMPEGRVAAGKPETGVVKLQAWHSGGEAWISISDDGRGVARDKVLAKAVSQGLVPANAALSDAEILALIFHPGFSMAKEVTEFSGRGVGMDVVKRNIEGLKGRVELESKFGAGTSFLIRLPMANALTESMLVRVGSVKYVLRVASIQETFRPTSQSVTRLPDGDEMVQLRGKLYPVIRLHRVHRIADGETELERGLIMIVENRGRQTGLFVDEVLGKIQAVIKPPPSLLKSAQTLAGCSIIGTDSDAVALALDINALDEKMASTEVA